MNLYIDLFLTFAKVGLFTFGGGYAMIALIERACVEEKHWISHDDMMNITVIAESTPGPIAINCATFVGYKQKGISGAVVATLGMVLPSFVIIALIASLLKNFLAIPLIACAFKGIKLAVGILVLDAAVTMIKKMQKKPLPRTIMLCGAAAFLLSQTLSLGISSVGLLLIAGAVSLFLFLRDERRGGKAGGKG